jgi:dienelactone hydrolase
MENELVSIRSMRRRSILKTGLLGALAAAAETGAHRGAYAQVAVSPGRANPQDKEARRRELYGLLGELPDRNRPVSAKCVSTEENEVYTLERLVLDLNGIQPVPAYFVRPRQTKGRTPAMLFNHSHFGQYQVGKNELTRGRDEMQKPPYAEELARHGYAALSIDAWGFGERRGQTESQIFKQMLWTGRVMWGMMVYDNLRALDYLVSRPEVDPKRIATMGMSMGSTMAWWLAALDTRITVCVDICCLTDYDALIEANGLDLHGIYYYVPNLLKYFTAAQINGLISPRPHLGIAGRYDPLTPYKGLMKIDAELREAYRRDGAPEAWKLNVYDIAHYETAEMRADILEFFKKWM